MVQVFYIEAVVVVTLMSLAFPPVQVYHVYKSVNVQGAKAKKWRVQWCGVGTI